jgi:hypothetical protein
MITSDVVSSAMHNFALRDPLPASPSHSADLPVGAIAAPVPVADSQPPPPIITDDDDEMPDMFNPEDYDSDFEDDDDDAVEANEATGQPAPTRRSARIAEGVNPPYKLTLTTNVGTAQA